MIEQPTLSESEWELVIQLLERERAELPVEIRHTRLSSVREELHLRRDMVAQLLERLGHLSSV